MGSLRTSVTNLTALQKILVIVCVLSLFCSLLSECLLCKFWPLQHSYESEGFADSAIIGPPTLTLYYANWCVFSKDFMPTWDKIKQSLLGTQVKLIEIDMDADPAGTKAAKISSYPTIMFSKDGKVTEYTGELTEEAIRRFVELM